MEKMEKAQTAKGLAGGREEEGRKGKSTRDDASRLREREREER